MLKVKVNFISTPRECVQDKSIKDLLRKACSTVLKYEKEEGLFEVNITFTDDESIRVLNRDFRGLDKSTDVLSFPLGENGEYEVNPENNRKQLGDVVISLDHAKVQSREYGFTYEREMCFLTVHSMLHLLGYDHVDDEVEARDMRSREKAVLSILGIRD